MCSRAIPIVFISLLLLTGCSEIPPHGPMPLEYRPAVKPLSGGEPAVALYLLRDLRHQHDGTVRDESYLGFVIERPYEGKGQPLYANERAAVTATRALAEGLKARGFPVVDRTSRIFRAGDEAGGARLALVGEVHRLGFSRREEASCVLRLELREIESGKKLWEKSFSSQAPIEGPGGLPTLAAAAVSEALSKTVDDAVMDRELTDLLTGS